MAWPKPLLMFLGSVFILLPVLSVKDYHPQWAGYNCNGNVGKGTVPHFLTRTLEDKVVDKLVCCHPTTCNGGTIKFCPQDNGTDICIPCPRNGSCNYENVTSEHLFTIIDFCTESCTRKNAVPDVVFYALSHTKKTGDDVTLKPTIHSDSELTGFIWKFINTTGSHNIANSLTGITNRRKYKVGTLPNPYLSIINIEPQDQGTYQLIVVNQIGSSNVKDVILNVTAKPIVSMTKLCDNVDAGSTYLISCTIIGNQEVIKSTFFFENIRGNVTEISSNVSPVGLMTHTILKTSSSDSGKYTCHAENSEGKAESTLHLTVDTKPIVSMAKASDNVDAGTTYVISCTIIANPEAIKSTFLFENIRGNVTEISSNVSPVGLMTHTILKTSSSDSGKYTCHAENSEGKAESTLHLTVDIPPEMYSPFAGRVMDSMIGDNVSISLWVSQTPDLDDLNCKHQNFSSKQMLLSLPYNRSNVGMSFNYTIMNVQPNDNGIYVCNATNRLGSSNFSVEINVTFHRTTTAPFEESESLDCKWLYYLTISFTAILIICVAVDLISVYNQTPGRKKTGRKKTICKLTILLIYAVVVIVVTGHGIEDCSTNTQNMVAVFCTIDIVILVWMCRFCRGWCWDVIKRT